MPTNQVHPCYQATPEVAMSHAYLRSVIVLAMDLASSVASHPSEQTVMAIFQELCLETSHRRLVTMDAEGSSVLGTAH